MHDRIDVLEQGRRFLQPPDITAHDLARGMLLDAIERILAETEAVEHAHGMASAQEQRNQ
jgi:hypothetical protein